MKTWYVKELSELTGLSVRTLHHYDHIGLLTPSVRRENGYRVYTVDDLLQLQQIAALKFLGFSLKQITVLLAGNTNLAEQLSLQKKVLTQKVKGLKKVLNALEKTLTSVHEKQIAETDIILRLMEGYRMSSDMDKYWRSLYSSEEVAAFEKLKSTFTQEEMSAYQQEWRDIIARVQAHIESSIEPESQAGQALAKEWQTLFDRVYGKQPLLRSALDRVYSQGNVPEQFMPKAVFAWIEKAKAAAGLKTIGFK